MDECFLDTNIVYNYSNHSKNSSCKHIERCYFFIKDETKRFVLCYAVINELNELIKKRARIHKAVIEKINDNNYSFEDSPLISKRDIPYAKQLFVKLKSYDVKKAEKVFSEDRVLSEIKIDKFIQFKVFQKVIPLCEINQDLIDKIHTYINNHADCKILASALQFQKDKELFLFVTADKKDFSPNEYSFLEEQFKINHSKENWIFPKLKNLLFN